MIRSMTGFGKAVGEFSDKKITVEIKSLNSKYLDLNVRLPSLYREKEMLLRKLIADHLLRGKVDCTIYVDSLNKEPKQTINTALVQSYLDDLKKIANTENVLALLPIAMDMPEVLISRREDLEEAEWEQLKYLVLQAIDKLDVFRRDEGRTIAADFDRCIKHISDGLIQVPLFEEERVLQIKQKIRQNIEELIEKEQVNESRLEQEMIFYMEKLDINEEKVRLTNHLNYFVEELQSSQANGKKLGFIAQEIGREINTLGAKANHVQIQKLTVQMKNELEKIKEQILNTL